LGGREGVSSRGSQLSSSHLELAGLGDPAGAAEDTAGFPDPGWHSELWGSVPAPVPDVPEELAVDHLGALERDIVALRGELAERDGAREGRLGRKARGIQAVLALGSLARSGGGGGGGTRILPGDGGHPDLSSNLLEASEGVGEEGDGEEQGELSPPPAIVTPGGGLFPPPSPGTSGTSPCSGESGGLFPPKGPQGEGASPSPAAVQAAVGGFKQSQSKGSGA